MTVGGGNAQIKVANRPANPGRRIRQTPIRPKKKKEQNKTDQQ